MFCRFCGSAVLIRALQTAPGGGAGVKRKDLHISEGDKEADYGLDCEFLSLGSVPNEVGSTD